MTDTEPNQKFSTPSDLLKIINDIEYSLLPRSSDLSLINTQFDGGRPFTPEEEKEHQIQVNANFLEGYKIAQDAILQVNTALLYKPRFCTARCVSGRATDRAEFTEKLTNNFNRMLKRGPSGKKFQYRMLNRDGALTLHAVGPMWWSNDYEWMPKFVPLDDLLIPTDTPLDFSDELGYFGINSWLTPWQLYRMTQSEKRDPGWDKTMGMEILKSLECCRNFSPDYFDKPEKMEELWKQRSVYLNSDAVPKLKITTFYHQDTETGQWWRQVLVRENQAVNISDAYKDKFLYNGKEPFADSVDQIIHVQYANGSVVAPFKYRSLRGLGSILYSVIELMNRLRCQFTQHIFSNLVPLLRVDNPGDRDRPRMLNMQPYSVVEQGITFVKAEERHQIDPRLVETGMAEFRQLMTESSASYVQDIDNGTGKAQTLGEAQIKLQSANKIVSAMLQCSYSQEGFLFEEILRRALNPTSTDPDVKKFQAACKRDGIPSSLMIPEYWEVEIEKVFGAGDQTLAQQQATSILAISPQLDPTSQRKVRRQYIAVMTQNPDLANDLVPKEQAKVTDGRKAAEDVFGTLMQGAEVGLREGIEQRDYVAAMLTMMEAVISRIEQTDQLGTPQEVMGLNNVAQNVSQHIEILSADPAEKAAVVAAGKELGKLMNMVKAYGQRQAEAKQKSQVDPEAEANIRTQQMIAAQKMEANQHATEQKLQQSQAKFDQKMEMDIKKHSQQLMQAQEKAAAENAAEMERLRVEFETLHAQSIAEITALQEKTAADIAAQQAKTASDIAASEAKAKAQPAEPKKSEQD